MKTIAISIDEPTLATLDRIARTGRAPGGGRRRRRTRSEIVREAVQRYLAEGERTAREARERSIFAKNRERLARQARALIADQASP